MFGTVNKIFSIEYLLFYYLPWTNATFSLFIFRDLVAELPFILMHPKPEEEIPPAADNAAPNSEVPVDTNLIQLDT